MPHKQVAQRKAATVATATAATLIMSASVEFTVGVADVTMSAILLPSTVTGWLTDKPSKLDAGYCLTISGNLAGIREMGNAN